MGTPEFAVPILESINASKHNLLGVYTQPPKKNLEAKKKPIPLSTIVRMN